jgi:leucyl aminopeptidase
LFLRRFIKRTKAWARFDIQAWTPNAKPGRPEGAEVPAARLLYDLLEARFGARYTVWIWPRPSSR